jgi:predicted SnoaL-like aldol condensation-catalyzing enzyme
MTYSNVAKETMNIAVMHLFRFDDHDKIVEMWDSGTALDSKSPNQNGAF